MMKKNIIERSKYVHALNLIELNEMEEVYPMILRERNMLRKWVYNGNSVNRNPWNYKDSRGYELNFIEGYHQHLKDKWGEFYRPLYRIISDNNEEKYDDCFFE